MAVTPTESAYTQVLIDRWAPVVGQWYAPTVARMKTIGLKSFGLSTVLIIFGLALYFPFGLYSAIVLVPGIGVGISYIVRKTRMEQALGRDMVARLAKSEKLVVNKPNFRSIGAFDDWLAEAGVTKEMIRNSSPIS